MPTYPGLTPNAPPDAGAPPMGDTPQDGPKELMTVCIEVYDDGTFKVGQEADESAAAPGMGDMGAAEPGMGAADDDAGYQSFSTPEEALDAAKKLLMTGKEGDMQSGFDSVAATMPNGPFQAGKM